MEFPRTQRPPIRSTPRIPISLRAEAERVVVQAVKEFCAVNSPPGTNSLLDKVFEAVSILKKLES